MITRLSVQHSGGGATNNTRQVPTQQTKQEEATSGHILHTMATNNNNSNFHSLSPTQGDQLSESTSPSLSLSNTDSDSLRSVPQQNVNNSNNNNTATSKSPILIKYNYYDYNGARQEQANHDMNYHHNQQQQLQQQNGAKVQRHLSPTFKQSLDQIVRNSQQQVQLAQSGTATTKVSPSPPSSSPEYNNMTTIHFARRYKLSSYEQRCLRCNTTVYQMDKVGPLKDFTFYHQNCFKCRECGTKLTLKTYFNNQQSSGDQEVYCHRHCPKTGPGRLDNQSVGIRAALNAPKVFDMASAAAAAATTHLASFHESANHNRGGQVSPTARHQQQHHLDNNNIHHHQLNTPNVDSRALYIQHAVQQTRLQNIYKQSQVDKKISQFINRRLEYLEPKQKMLEMRHREEEDALFKAFELKWRQEESCISEQIRHEWQAELSKLFEKYKRQLSSMATSGAAVAASHHHHHTTTTTTTSHNQQPLVVAPNAGHRPLTVSQPVQHSQQHHHQVLVTNDEPKKLKKLLLKQLSELGSTTNGGDATAAELNEQQMIEFERMNLEKTMTIKLDRKKETLKRKLKEFERQATAELVEKQSREMLALISMKLEEYKEEQKRKIGSDLEQFEAIESLANQLGSSLQLSANAKPAITSKQASISPTNQQQHQQQQNGHSRQQLTPAQNGQQVGHLSGVVAPLEAPAPKPPQVSKMELYNSDEPDELFRDIDQLAINVAREDQQTFTDLVHHLTRHCLTDIEKVRAIFRWITVKNLNTMQFDSSVKPDTPLGLLRGIKNGSESYHVLFKRLCSYAGLHCVVIKGYSKSAGYQPGVKFEGNRFRNSWNAVYVAGAWRFVQCNWGARHLVSVAVMQDKNQQTNKPTGGSEGAKQQAHAVPALNTGRSQQQHHSHLSSPNHGRRGMVVASNGVVNNKNGVAYSQFDANFNAHHLQAAAAPGKQPQHSHRSASNKAVSPLSSSSSLCSSSSPSSTLSMTPSSPPTGSNHHHRSGSAATTTTTGVSNGNNKSSSDSLRYEYDDHYFLTDPDEFIYEFYPISPEWQLIKTRPITLAEFEQLPFVRSLFFKYGLYFPQHDIRSVLHTDSSGATTIKIGMPTHMIPSLIFHYNLKYYDSDMEHYEGVSLKRFVMQSVESGGASDSSSNGQTLLSNIVSFRVHLPENGAYILDIFANSTTRTQYITGEPMKFKSVCKFKIVAKNLKTVMVPLPDCASGEYGPMKATRLFGIIPITHESGLIGVQNDKRFLEIQFRMTRPLSDFMASLHKNGYDERQLSKSIKIFIDGDIVFVTVKFFEDGQYGLDIYTRDQVATTTNASSSSLHPITGGRRNGGDELPVSSSGRHLVKATGEHPLSDSPLSESKKQLLTHCCKYLINVRAPNNR